MATLDFLKQALRRRAEGSLTHPLSELEYNYGFDTFVHGAGWATYRDFIIPQLTELLEPLFAARNQISVLEIGPGSKSIFGELPIHQKSKITRYAAFEPSGLLALSLQRHLCETSNPECPLPLSSLRTPPVIYLSRFALDSIAETATDNGDVKFDVILFCHSMYGMEPKGSFVRRALDMLPAHPGGELVVVFHRDGLHLDGLVCHRTTSFPTGVVSVPPSDDALDKFASFVAGFGTRDPAIQADWRNICRTLGRHEEAYGSQLLFSAPEVMFTFTRHATALPELKTKVPLAEEERSIKNWEARLRRPAAIVHPTTTQHVQECVRWALRHDVALTVIGGGHSGHCLQPNVVAVDMSAFNQMGFIATSEGSNIRYLVLAGAGCRTEDIVRKTMERKLAVPLGARPSVGAGLWLQGGIGHLSRLHGLTCDAVVGALLVRVDSGQVVSLGCVPSQWRPSGVKHLDSPSLLKGIKGAGTNFGIVLAVVFKASAEPTYRIGKSVVPLSDEAEALHKLRQIDSLVAQDTQRQHSTDVYLYRRSDRLHLGLATFETFTSESGTSSTASSITDALASVTQGQQHKTQLVDGIRVFETEMYMSTIHSEHRDGRTYSFKRCLFLPGIEKPEIAEALVEAIKSPATPLCYLHLLQGGGAIKEVTAETSAFGCRDWKFACVITGVWARDQANSETAAATAVRWVYEVAMKLLPFSSGVYGADLGPDPRDAALAARANLPRLARLKPIWDPRNVLAYACPLPIMPPAPALIVLVTGESNAGKDYSAEVFVEVLNNKGHISRVASISEDTKREYAAKTGADLERLFHDRTYKEQHRASMTDFYQEQVRQRPGLPNEHFRKVVHNAAGAEVLFITGMRDKTPVATFSHLVPESRVIKVRVLRRHDDGTALPSSSSSSSTPPHDPAFTFANSHSGAAAACTFATTYLLPFLNPQLAELAVAARPIPDFPKRGIEFRHVLNIAQQPRSLALCSGLLRDHYALMGARWEDVEVIASVETGGFVFATMLAVAMGLPLALIREEGKVPPPRVAVDKGGVSHISGVGAAAGGGDNVEGVQVKRIAMEKGLVRADDELGAKDVVVVDDVLASGTTLCAVLRLLKEAGVGMRRVRVLVVAEFPLHRAREVLIKEGFGGVDVRSLLVFGVR